MSDHRSSQRSATSPTSALAVALLPVIATIGLGPIPLDAVLPEVTLPTPGPGIGVQTTTILALYDPIGVDHEEDFLNRRTILTVSYRTGILIEESCSDVNPEDVVLILELPTGIQFLEAMQEGAPLPPTDVSGGTVTWELGTLDRFEHCGGTDVAVTIEADPGLADDEELLATASISTSTAGDDPADNEVSVVFPAVMFPLEVVMESARTECLSEAPGTVKASDEGATVACGLVSASDGGLTSAGGVAYRTDAPGLIGLVTASGLRPYVRSAPLRVRGHSYDDGLQAGASVETRVRINNPNPFQVPLNVHLDAALHCLVADGQAAVRVVGPTGFEAECGFGNVENMVERVRLHHQIVGGPDGACETRIVLISGERPDEVIEETHPFCNLQRVNAGSHHLIDFELAPGTAGDSYAFFNARAGWCIGISAHSCPATLDHGAVLRVRAESPVDLQVTDADGLRTGAVDDPDLGTVEAAQIPGSSYTGAGSEPQTISLGLPDPGEYALTVLGRDEGPFTITVTAEDDDGNVTAGGTLTGEAAAGMVLERDILVGEDGRVALEPQLGLEAVTAHLLGVEGTLDDAELDYLDLLGNQNGGFDVGDFRAFLASIGMIPSE